MAGARLKAFGLTATKTLLRTGPCFVTDLRFINTDGGIRFCQLFDAAAIADVTLATTQPDWVLVAAAGGEDDGPQEALVFDKGIVAAATTTATGDTGAAGSKCNLFVSIE